MDLEIPRTNKILVPGRHVSQDFHFLIYLMKTCGLMNSQRTGPSSNPLCYESGVEHSD